VSFRSAVPALAVLILAAFPAVAEARAWDIQDLPAPPVAGEPVTFHAVRANPGNGGGESLVWDFGDGTTATGQDVTHVYDAAGPYTVILSSPETETTLVEEDRLDIQVESPPPPPPPENRAPSAAFTFSPTNPLVGEGVLFTGGSDPDGDPITRLWDFDDGTTSSDATPTHAYATEGSYTVTLTVFDDGGLSGSTFKTVTVSPRPGSSSDGGSTPSSPGTPIPPSNSPGTKKSPVPMRPFPIVRIAGVVLPHGALVRILSVRASRGARIEARCSGRGCPTSKLARTSATRLVRLRPFERRLRAGVRLELFVRKPGRIGKYTRFVIRAGKPPARVDRCLLPGRAPPVSCP
jgi:chitodextrinase